MSSIHFKDETALKALVSDDFGPWSNSVKVDQAMINTFADLTGDHMWMHVDEARAASDSPFGSTIAHGFLVLSLLPKMATPDNPIMSVTGFSHMMNYGSDKLRFLGAVPVGSELACRSRIKDVEVLESKTRVVLEQHVHVVSNEKPVLIYELIFVYL